MFVVSCLGCKFPALKEADAMFDAEKAPSWKDGETCTRCRVQFSVMQRKVTIVNSSLRVNLLNIDIFVKNTSPSWDSLMISKRVV